MFEIEANISFAAIYIVRSFQYRIPQLEFVN